MTRALCGEWVNLKRETYRKTKLREYKETVDDIPSRSISNISSAKEITNISISSFRIRCQALENNKQKIEEILDKELSEELRDKTLKRCEDVKKELRVTSEDRQIAKGKIGKRFGVIRMHSDWLNTIRWRAEIKGASRKESRLKSRRVKRNRLFKSKMRNRKIANDRLNKYWGDPIGTEREAFQQMIEREQGK